MPSRNDITRLLADLSAGKEEAGEAVMSLIYDELRALAKSHMHRERSGHTLQTTALVHEAFIRLGGGKVTAWESRAHFMRTAAQAMRRILIDHARRKATDKLGGGRRRTPLDELAVFDERTSPDLLALDRALDKLAAVDPQVAQMVELRFFGGLTVKETAQVLDVSPRTVDYDWRMAKAWLQKEIQGGDDS